RLRHVKNDRKAAPRYRNSDLLIAGAALVAAPLAAAQELSSEAFHEHRAPALYAPARAFAPTPVPERIVLTWSADPATTQSVTWRTDTSVLLGVAEIAVANANGRALQPDRLRAETTHFRSDINEAHYHTVTFRGLEPDTIYTYRVG